MVRSDGRPQDGAVRDREPRVAAEDVQKHICKTAENATRTVFSTECFFLIPQW